MRKLIVLCLLVAIGAVAMIQRADAGPNTPFKCKDRPGQAECPNIPPPQPQIGMPSPEKNPHGWQGNNRWRNHSHTGLYFGLDVGEPPPRYGYGSNYYPGQCRDVAFMLRDQGFENVRPLRCSGPRLIFSAWRDGESVTLYVSRDGRIRRIIPNY